jgi:enoyl-CoA hydratase/carnithine racemase
MAQIETQRDGAVFDIRINRPEKKNALTGDMYYALADAVEEGERDSAARVLLFYGAGDTFCAGNDLKDFVEKPWSADAVPPQVRVMRAFAAARKPIVAAVQGAAVGIGTTILLHCDLLYAAEGASFIMPFVNLGIVPEAGSTVLLPLLIGKHRAAELFMLCSPLTAQRAFEIGLVNAVVPSDKLLTTATQSAQQLAARPAEAILACKELMKRPFGVEVERAIDEEAAVVRERLNSPESQQAIAAFLGRKA